MSSDRGMVTTMVLGALIVVGSRWAQNKPLDPKIGVGAVAAAVGLSAIYTWSPPIGKGLAATFLVTIIVTDGPPLFKALDKVSSKPIGDGAKIGKNVPGGLK